MALRYHLRSPDGSTIVPATDGEHIISDMLDNYTSGVVFIRTCDSDGNPVAATGGTITVTSSPDGVQYLEPSNSTGVINAADCGVSASYDAPVFSATASHTKFVLSGITGATHIIAYHVRY